jgi:hypothetical protein
MMDWDPAARDLHGMIREDEARRSRAWKRHFIAGVIGSAVEIFLIKYVWKNAHWSTATAITLITVRIEIQDWMGAHRKYRSIE